MANYFARKAGNINATDVWATTPSGTAGAVTFVSGDVLYSNNFTITVNVSTDLGSTGQVRNDNTNGATAGVFFSLLNGVTLTANVFAGSSAVVSCVVFSLVSGNSATLVGNPNGGSNTSAVGINNSSSGTLNIIGNPTGGTSGSANGVQNSSTGIVNITGSPTGGSSGAAAQGVNGAYNASTGTINITGNVIGGGVVGGDGARNQSTGTINITGNAIGGSISDAVGARNFSTGTITITGSASASNNAIGAINSSTGILSVIRAIGNGWGIGATGVASNVGISSAVVGSQTRVEEFEYGSLGQAPTGGAVSCPDKTSNVCLVHRLSTTKKTLIDAASVSGALPAASDVRFGITFNQGNTTGTLRVPAAGSVALGVLVDNTSGTAVLTPSAIWDALTSGMTTSGSIGARLKNAATVDTTGQALADALSPTP